MSFALLRQKVATLFSAGWDDRFPVERPNMPFEQPENGIWGRLSVTTGRTVAACTGKDGFDRVPGFVTLQVFAPRHTGTGAAEAALDAFAGIFQDQLVAVAPNGWIHFEKASREYLGETEQARQVFNCRAAFHYDAPTVTPAVLADEAGAVIGLD